MFAYSNAMAFFHPADLLDSNGFGLFLLVVVLPIATIIIVVKVIANREIK